MSDLSLRLLSGVGYLVMIGLAWAMSYDRRAFPVRLVVIASLLQLFFGLIVLRTTLGVWAFSVLNDAVTRLLTFTNDGSRFLFGDYLDEHFTMALNVLPTIIFFSALMTVLYHLGLMQRVVRGLAWVMQRTLGTSGAETLSAAANIFVGQTEAPLVIKPFVATLTQSEMMAIMLGGFANVAGGVMAAYVGMLQGHFPGIAGHLIASSVLSAPASLLVAKVILPEKETPATGGSLDLDGKSPYANVIDAAATGASDGLQLALNVAAMLLAFMALVAMVNFLFSLPALMHNRAEWETVLAYLTAHGHAVPEGCTGDLDADGLARCIDGARPLLDGLSVGAWHSFSMQTLAGYLGWPLAFVMGVPVNDCLAVSTLLGEKLVLNEFVAYVHLAENIGSAHPMSERAMTIASYALCGFANLSSIAIQIGGIGALAPERRQDLARLGMRAMLGGTLATYLTACVAGMLA